MRIRKNGKVIRLTESDLRRITKKVLSEQTLNESDCIEYLKKEGYSDITTEFRKPDGVMFLHDGVYKNISTDKDVVIIGYNGKPTGYALCLQGDSSMTKQKEMDLALQGYDFPHPISKVKIYDKGYGLYIYGELKNVDMKNLKVFLNDELLKQCGVSTKIYNNNKEIYDNKFY